MALVGDERGQAVQIGAVLLFAVLIVSFSTYQAFVVPNQNRQVEFNHNQQAQRDMIEVRNTLLETYTGGNDGYAELTLGTNYPARIVATNPGPPGGSFRTTDARPIVVEASGSDVTDAVCPGSNIQTRFLEYEPSYNVYQGAGTIRYEHSYLYHDFRDGSVNLTSQSIVQDDQVQIIPITNDVDVGGTQTIAVEPKPGLLDTSQRERVNVTLPTRLSEDRWEAILAGEVDATNVTVTTDADGEKNVTLTLGQQTIDCGPVGLDETPPSGTRGGGVDEINPAAPGDIRLEGETRNGDNVTLDFNNTAGTNNITEARINFYEAQSNEPATADILSVGEPTSETLDVGGDFETLSPKISLAGGGTVTQVKLAFNGGNVNPNDWFVITIQLETGETGVYFISAS